MNDSLRLVSPLRVGEGTYEERRREGEEWEGGGEGRGREGEGEERWKPGNYTVARKEQIVRQQRQVRDPGSRHMESFQGYIGSSPETDWICHLVL